jgi:hypothetical protein
MRRIDETAKMQVAQERPVRNEEMNARASPASTVQSREDDFGVDSMANKRLDVQTLRLSVEPRDNGVHITFELRAILNPKSIGDPEEQGARGI